MQPGGLWYEEAGTRGCWQLLAAVRDGGGGGRGCMSEKDCQIVESAERDARTARPCSPFDVADGSYCRVLLSKSLLTAVVACRPKEPSHQDNSGCSCQPVLALGSQ